MSPNVDETKYTTTTRYNNKDDDDVHLADIVVGQTLRGSVVTNLKVEVVDDNEKYKIKKYITLLNGIILISLYIKTKAEGLSDLEKAGEVSMSPAELEKLQKLNQKDDSAARAKAREAMAKRKSGGAAKPTPPPPPKPEPPKTFDIQVKTFDDGKKIIPLKGINPTDTVNDIKNKIEKQEGIPVKDQRLVFGDKSLDDRPDSTMEKEGIKDGSVLELVEPTFDIQVTTPDGKNITVKDVKPSDTVQDIKSKVQDQTGIPIKDQRLVHDGKELVDPNATMKDNDIKDGSKLNMLEPLFDIKVKTPDGKKVIDVKDVKASDTIDDIKQKINKLEGSIPIKDQRLVYNNVELTNPKSTLKDNGIKDGSTLDLIDPVMTVTVQTPDGRTISVDNVKKTDKVEDIKKRVHVDSSIPMEDIRLVYKNNELVDPKATMKKLDVKDGDVFDMLDPVITVKVKTPDGSLITIENVKKTDTVDDIKKRVRDGDSGIPNDEDIRLSFKNKELTKPKTTIEKLGVKDGDVLDILENVMSIKVKTPDGKKTITIDNVKKTDTVQDIKDRIANNDKDGIPVKQQRLHLGKKELTDPMKTMNDIGVKDGSVLELKPATITVVKPDGKTTFEVTVMPGDTIKDLHRKIEDVDGTPMDYQRLFFDEQPIPSVEDPDGLTGIWDFGLDHGSTIVMKPMEISVKTPTGAILGPYKVTPSNTIMDVKELMMNDKKHNKDLPATSTKDLRIKFGDDKLDDDRKTLRDHDIKHGSTLNLDGMRIHVKVPNKAGPITLDVSPKDTIKDVKKQLKSKIGIPTSDQRLSKDGNDAELDDDKSTLQACGIVHDSTLVLDDSIEINVRNGSDKLIPLTVKPYDTVKSIKEQLEKLKGIPVKDQSLMNGKIPLDNDDSKLSDFKIKNGTTLDLVSNKMQIYVKDWNGKKILIPDVDKDTTVDDIHKKIEEMENVPIDQQFLVFDGNNLNDPQKTLGQCKVPNDGVINLEKYKIYVKTPHSKFLLSHAVPSSTIQNVKDMIQTREGLHPKEQTLVYNDEELDELRATLLQYGIPHRSIIHLERPDGDPSEDTPEYDVKLGEWQSSFGFVSKDKKERVGRRKKKPLGMLY